MTRSGLPTSSISTRNLLIQPREPPRTGWRLFSEYVDFDGVSPCRYSKLVDWGALNPGKSLHLCEVNITLTGTAIALYPFGVGRLSCS